MENQIVFDGESIGMSPPEN